MAAINEASPSCGLAMFLVLSVVVPCAYSSTGRSPLQAASVAALHASLQLLEAAWTTQAHQLPALAVPAGATPWAQRWEQHQAHSQQAQAQLRLAAAPYNAAIAQFPAQLLASIFGFKAAQTL